MLLRLWNRLSQIPLGRFFFQMILAQKVPYTGSICPKVLELTSKGAVVQMKDRRRVRNHLNSVHAVALMNLGEVTSGLAVVAGLPDSARAILTHFEIDFLKKARGTLTASASSPELPTKIIERRTYQVSAEIENEEKMTVARIKAHWLIGPKDN